MQLLNHQQCGAWLANRKIVASPYGVPLRSGVRYAQLKVPKPRPSGRKLVDGMFGVIRPQSDVLVRVEDWSRLEELFKNEELANLASAFPDALTAWEVQVGVVFEEAEIERLSACCTEVIDQGMSAYLYVPEMATLLLWEGDLVDFWSEERSVAKSLMAWVRKEGITVASEAVD